MPTPERSQTVHTLAGSPVDALTLNGTGCNAWNEGLEQQVDSGIMPGTQNALVTIKNTYAAQTGCMSNLPESK